ncbi:MAG: 4-hydroxy-tetrahydrodipicolinate synthase [Armatimonadetes bacterium]|nr:4-hydroxy-tetrahydrodipicolinate synthase [Armatimonadota bacterium]
MAGFGHVLTAMATPFDEELRVDLDRAGQLALFLVENGSDGLVVAGTTGEAPTTTAQEKLALFRVVKEAVGDTATVIAGTGNNDTLDSIELTRAVADLDLDLDGVMLTGPYYNKPSQEGFYQHFKAVAAVTDLPVILYNVPARTSKNIEAATVLRLAEEVDNIVAIKEASGDLEQISVICAGAPDGFTVYSGEDMLTLPMLAVGCLGVISVASHLAGKQIAAMIHQFHAGEVQLAAQTHQSLVPIIKACFMASGNPACVKRGLEILGFPVGGVRLPLVEASESDTAAIRQACEGLGLV